MFAKYCFFGVFNTILHWVIFYCGYFFMQFSQAVANLVAFFCAVNVSYYLNSKFNFNRPLTGKRYLWFVGLMSLLSFSIGGVADLYQGWPIFTLIVFSGSSMVLGYLFSKYIVFRG